MASIGYIQLIGQSDRFTVLYLGSEEGSPGAWPKQDLISNMYNHTKLLLPVVIDQNPVNIHLRTVGADPPYNPICQDLSVH
jgi:hypothetical protein